MLQGFQRLAARRIQRFHARSINSTSTACLGWMDIIRVMNAKKLIFVRSMACMNDYAPIKAIFKGRLDEFLEEDENLFDCPANQMLKIAFEFQVIMRLEICLTEL